LTREFSEINKLPEDIPKFSSVTPESLSTTLKKLKKEKLGQD